MGQILSQLRCARCRERFWPEREAYASVAIVCPGCGAAHVNVGARSWQVIPTHPYPGVSYHREAIEWLEHNWAGEQLPCAGGLESVNPINHATRVRPFVVDEVSGCVFECVRYRRRKQVRCAFVVAMMVPPAHPPPLGDHGYAATWSEGGFWFFAEGEVRDEVLIGGVTRAMVARARSVGAAPLFAIEVVPDPEPADPTLEARELEVAEDLARDAALATRNIRCAQCGAPVAVTELAAQACPYCAAPQRLPAEVAHELELYRRRIHAALLRAPGLTLRALKVGASSAGTIAVVCVSCGAPSTIRPGEVDGACASCGAPLVPSRAIIDRGLAAGAALADASYRQAGAQVAQRRMAFRASARTTTSALLIILLVSVVPIAWMPALPLVVGGTKIGIPWFVSAGVLLLACVACVVWALRSVRRRARAQLERWHPRFAALAAQVGGSASDDPRALTAWAARWWSDHLAPTWVVGGRTRGVITFALGGFPMAITAHPEHSRSRLTGQPSAQHLALLLAGRLPRDVAYWSARGEAKRIIDDMREAGFDLELRTGGLSLHAAPDALPRVANEPDRLSLLAPMAFALVRLAHHLRAEAPARG